MGNHQSDEQLIEEILSLINRHDTEGLRRALLAAVRLGRPIRNLHLIRAVALETGAISFAAWGAVEKELALFPDSDAARNFLQQLRQKSTTKPPIQSSSQGPLISIVAVIGDDWSPWLRALRSVFYQQFSNVEVVAVLQTQSVQAQEALQALDRRVRVLLSPVSTYVGALEFGLQKAQGRYQMVLKDSSVLVTDPGLRALGQMLQQMPTIEFVCGERTYLDDIDFPVPMRSHFPRWSRAMLLDRDNLQPPCVTMSFSSALWSKELFERAGNRLDGTLKEAFDFELFCRFLRHTNCATATVPIAATYIRGDTYSDSYSIRYVSEALRVIDRELREKPLIPKDSEAPALVKLKFTSVRHTPTPISNQRPSEKALHLLREKGPRISVVTPSFNQGEFLEQTIDSILSQGYPHLEYMILDGGSTDGSVEIIKKYERHLTFWRSFPDGGQYFAVQEGLERTTGEVMTWLNSDDKLKEYALWYVGLMFLLRPDVSWVTGRCASLLETGEESVESRPFLYDRKSYLEFGYDRPFIQQEGSFWRRSLWEQAGGSLNLSLSLAADMELWCRFFRHTTLEALDMPLALFRVNPTQRSQVFLAEYHRQAEAVARQERYQLLTEGARIEPSKPSITAPSDLMNQAEELCS